MAPSTELLFFLSCNFTLTTWLTVGACLQSLLFLMFPRHLALLPAFTLLIVRLVNGALITKGYTSNPYLPYKTMGKMTAPVVREGEEGAGMPGEEEVVCFVVGANVNQCVFSGRFGAEMPKLRKGPDR